MPRSEPVNRHANEKAALELCKALDLHVNLNKCIAILPQVIKVYLREAKKQVVSSRNLSPITDALIKTEIGEIVYFKNISLQSVRARMETARTLMDNQGARWSCSIEPDNCIQVTRVEDFANVKRYKALGSITVELSSMQPGDSFISQYIKAVRGKGQAGSNHKMKARSLLDDEKADWSFKMTNQGVRVTRVK